MGLGKGDSFEKNMAIFGMFLIQGADPPVVEVTSITRVGQIRRHLERGGFKISMHTVVKEMFNVNDTVDGSEIPNNHLGCSIKPWKEWEIYHIILVQDFFHQQSVWMISWNHASSQAWLILSKFKLSSLIPTLKLWCNSFWNKQLQGRDDDEIFWHVDLFEFHGRNCRLFDRPTDLSKMVALRPNSLADQQAFNMKLWDIATILASWINMVSLSFVGGKRVWSS